MIAILQNIIYKFHVFIGLKGAWIMLVIVYGVKRIISTRSISGTFSAKPHTFNVVVFKIILRAFGVVHYIAALAYNKFMVAKYVSFTTWTSLPVYIKIYGGHLVKMLLLRPLHAALL